MRPVSIYIHIPFCVKKCNYCDFISAPASNAKQIEYLHILQEEIASSSDKYTNYTVDTIFVGGGTPSVVESKLLCEVLDTLREGYHVEEDAEITVEVNPKTATREALLFYRGHGVNRLSIGMQSSLDAELKLLGRIHTYEDFLTTYRLARECGFSNVNVDIMSALPGQRPADYERTIRNVLSLEPPPEHISAYGLIIEEGTPFFEWYGEECDRMSRTGEAAAHLPSEEEERAMYRMTQKLLADAGYGQYEISNYCLEGRMCRHNAVYWRRGDYVGFGLGAASMVDNVRFSNTADMGEYMAGGWRDAPRKRLTVVEQMEEHMFLGLRMTEGVSEKKFREEFGVSVDEVYGSVIEKEVKAGLLRKSGGRIMLTREGIDVSNHVMAQFLLS